jgi:hypothetical protein
MRTSMTKRLAHSLLVMACVATPLFAQQDEAALKKDLTAVIALQGKPCGEVVSVTVLKQNDYGATCKDATGITSTKMPRAASSSTSSERRAIQARRS